MVLVAAAAAALVPVAHGRTPARADSSSIAAMANAGYWQVHTDGRVDAFGLAPGLGSTPPLAAPAVAAAGTPDAKGFWVAASDGGVFTFGDAAFYGSTGGIHLSAPMVGIAPTPSGRGYWLVGSDGGVFSFGDAGWFGSVGSAPPLEPVERLVPGPQGAGYWLITQTGDAYAYGSATTADLPVQALLYRSVTVGDRAVDFAEAQLGKPYVWGGSGPDGFDCSGLTLRAWQYAAGVTIPRVAADQYGFGARIPLGSLSAGDLVYWSDSGTDPAAIGHVALYVGGGWMINAPQPGQVVDADAIGGGGFMPFGTRP